MSRRRTQKDGHFLLDLANPVEARNHLQFLSDVVKHNYGAVDGEIEIEFLAGLIDQLDKEGVRLNG